ncbi:hypothetical protein MNBD_GAMMA22-1359 [hydrothermal vent metagenome]|uniref:Copper metallochaperone, bacterial analog of Cox17 protein n=1 Tax=hydrothermal vent metagenome TaxID=652676 RepID=A0A3B1AFZ6_9ZZZZ
MTITSNLILKTLLTTILLSSVTNSWAKDLITLSDAWVADAPPNSKMYAGYLSIKNHSDKTFELITVSSPMFKKIEIHKTQIINNIARMIEQNGLTINKKSATLFTSGDLHLMMIEPKSTIKLGNKITLTFKFKNTLVKSITATVKKRISN